MEARFIDFKENTYPEKGPYTLADLRALPEGQRAELLDGKIYYMDSPNATHQQILGALHQKIADYVTGKGGPCEVFAAPFAVFLNEDSDYLEPDIVVVCDPGKIEKGDGCHGGPDWVIEIVSPDSAKRDYMLKTAAYSNTGVKEYWIIDPHNEIINIYNFSDEVYHPTQYDFTDQVKVGICEDLVIDFSQFDLTD
ncbi:MAG: Uma2 family endonuclease [Lachnospiraceae bacterium]|jgi:Uma2 family endonuclease|nr:Uma2 family endonuclease [Lachnospiraceae bacterium]